MNSKTAARSILGKLSITLALLMISCLALGQSNKKPESAPAAPSASKRAPAAQRPAPPANRGPAQNSAQGRPHNAANTTHGPNAAHGAPTTTREIPPRSGASVQASYKGGHVRTIQAHNMKIEHSAHGQRRIEAVHNGRRVVSMGGRRGYMERPYLNRGGRTYVQRTYYVGGRSYVYAYRTYYYGGAP